MLMSRRPSAAVAMVAWLFACKGQPDSTPWCSAESVADVDPPSPSGSAPTYYQHIRPIVESKCAFCHKDGGTGAFVLNNYNELSSKRAEAGEAVRRGHMPPWFGARCCTDYFRDFSLTPKEKSTFLAWTDGAGLEGDVASPGAIPSAVGGLSRVDVTVGMPTEYVPQPPAGSTDDTRCFVIDWPLSGAGFITGMNPRPGQRSVVHHLVVGLLDSSDYSAAQKRDDESPGAGFDCSGSLGEFPKLKLLGGSLLGGDFPRGIGSPVSKGAKLLLNIHYSTEHAAAVADKTSIEFRVDAQARDAKAMVIENLAWLAGDGMLVRAGEKDAVYFYRVRPNLFTGNKPAQLQSVTAHMHHFGSKIVVRRIGEDGKRECLLEIPKWEFGWEQPYWFAKEKYLGANDELYIECHFDNSAANQRDGAVPRDFAWGGNNQDMCVAFLSFTQ